MGLIIQDLISWEMSLALGTLLFLVSFFYTEFRNSPSPQIMCFSYSKVCCCCCCLVTQLCPTLRNPMDRSMPGLPVHRQLPEFTQTHVHWVSDAIHFILCPPLLLPPSIFPSIRVFSNESVLLIRWPKYWSFSFSISPSNEYSGLISFRIDWVDFLAVQGTLKSLLQYHSSKASILQCSAFFILTSVHDYWKNHSFD